MLIGSWGGAGGELGGASTKRGKVANANIHTYCEYKHKYELAYIQARVYYFSSLILYNIRRLRLYEKLWREPPTWSKLLGGGRWWGRDVPRRHP